MGCCFFCIPAKGLRILTAMWRPVRPLDTCTSRSGYVRHNSNTPLWRVRFRFRVGVTGSGPTKGMPTGQSQSRGYREWTLEG
eukprot:353294-Chlamydomonas_euryale.AAC.2